MTCDARLPALRRPATVAVHDNRHMSGQTIPSDARQKRLVPRPLLYNCREVREHPFISSLKLFQNKLTTLHLNRRAAPKANGRVPTVYLSRNSLFSKSSHAERQSRQPANDLLNG